MFAVVRIDHGAESTVRHHRFLSLAVLHAAVLDALAVVQLRGGMPVFSFTVRKN